MSLRFSDDGPEFPGELVDSILAGDVVFLCGTGVSAPQLPGFASLVERVYEVLAVEKTDSEERALSDERYEEVLGSLSRRLADSNAVTRTVSDLLAVPEHPFLDQHRTILRLSRNLDNSISVVTTNFDTLLERAVATVTHGAVPVDVSFAGQALPAPGSSAFSGIIHIHGRLADPVIGLEQTPLVLTSSDYGDAYMRSGWASRFLFDLARCKTIVLVGYSANDAPVRYFLNLLESDRARFPDLKQVYAFDAYERDPVEATGPWGTLAVTPLPYCKVNSETGASDHSPLWRDLEALAEVAERPKRYLRDRARAILEQPVADAGAVSRRELVWLFDGRQDLWPVATDAIADPAWFDFIQQEGLWSPQNIAWVIASWIATNFEDRTRLECACEWQRRLGQPFTKHIERHLRHTEGLDELWTRIWQFFCLVEPGEYPDSAYHATRSRLVSGIVLYSDLHAAVRLLAPRLELNPRPRERPQQDADQPDEELSDILWPRIAISDQSGAGELIDTLRELPEHAGRILELARNELRSTLELEVELEMIGDEHDRNDFTVPSIESHAQNQYREGVNFLVRVMVESLPRATDLDRDETRRVVVDWQRLPGRIGLRLCLHAMRIPQLFESDEALSTLLTVSDIDFWIIRREIALLLRDRAADAPPALVSQVEDRIRVSGDTFFDRYPIKQGEADWRTHARDTAVWLRLHMLRDAGVLSDDGVAELAAITERREYLNRTVEERDFFGSYGSGPRSIEGDPAQIVQAPADDRLRVARELVQSPSRDLRQGWSAYCRYDPHGAFDSLSDEGLTPANAALWNEFLSALAFGDEQSKAVRDDLSVLALQHLSEVHADTLQLMAAALCNVIFFGPTDRINRVDTWVVRLWNAISTETEEYTDLPTDSYNDLFEYAINSPAGRLSQILLLEIEARKRQDDDATAEQLDLLRRICQHDGPQGQLGRAVFARDIAFLLSADRQFVDATLRPFIDTADSEGTMLRPIMLTFGSITPEVSRIFTDAITTGVVETAWNDYHTRAIASNILRPALADIKGDEQHQWGFSATDIAQLLRRAPQSIQSAALQVLSSWLGNYDGGAAAGWREMISPFFERVWPKESEFRDPALTPHLIDLVVGSGDELSTALDMLRPYISPYDRGHGSLYGIASSQAPERFPRQTLELLWLVAGPRSRGSFYEIANIIDRLIEADPDIEVDRRLQWLDQHAERLH